jgi:ubiquinol oxidase
VTTTDTSMNHESVAAGDSVRDAATAEAPPRLAHDDLVRAQAQTLASPRRGYSVAARLLFVTLDLLYGTKRTLSKFKVLELVARVPYQAWEQAAYVAVTHVHERTGLSRRIYHRILESRSQQDNEQWHLFILDEQIAASGVPESRLMFNWIPQIIAFVYYQISWILFVLWPKASYRLNADFEDHAEHEYMTMVTENPEWETAPFVSDFKAEYGDYASVADVFRQIGHDERVHKIESEAQLPKARFSI